MQTGVDDTKRLLFVRPTHVSPTGVALTEGQSRHTDRRSRAVDRYQSHLDGRVLTGDRRDAVGKGVGEAVDRGSLTGADGHDDPLGLQRRKRPGALDTKFDEGRVAL